MKTDIFEDMKERVGCENISDLPYRKRMVWEIIKQHSPLDYPKEQLEKFSHYVFGVDYAVIMGMIMSYPLRLTSTHPLRKSTACVKWWRTYQKTYRTNYRNC